MLNPLQNKSLFLTVILLFVSVFLKAQTSTTTDRSGWQIGAYGGITQYFGDISNKSAVDKFSGETKIAYGLFVRRHFNEYHGIGFSYTRNNIFSQKDLLSTGTAVNLEYSGTANQYAVHTYLNFRNFFWGYADRSVNLFGTLGLGYAKWSGTLRNYGNNAVIVDMNSAVAGNFNTGGPIFPISLGIDFVIAPNVRLQIESTLTTILSDDLDYYRDGYQYDFLTQTQIGISYVFGGNQNKVRQPKSSRSFRPAVASQTWEPAMPISVIDYENYPKRPEETHQPKVELPPLKLPEVTTTQQPTTTTPSGFEFRVQIYAKGSRVSSPSSIYRNITFEYPVVENYFNGIYRYSTGSFKSYSEAEAYARKLQARGVYDAFVVAYNNNERISITSEMKR